MHASAKSVIAAMRRMCRIMCGVTRGLMPPSYQQLGVRLRCMVLGGPFDYRIRCDDNRILREKRAMSKRASGLLRIGLIGAALCAVAVRPARAGFDGGVERFDGTLKDTATWQEYVGGNEVISQNNALFITDPQGGISGNAGDYTTRHVALLPESTVSARAMVGGTGLASLFRTSNSAGATALTQFDSSCTQLVVDVPSGSPDGSITRWIGGSGSGTQSGLVAQVSNPIGQTFKLEIVRPNSKDYTYRAYDAQGLLLGSNSYIGSISHPEALFISLGGINGMSATWDDVTVTGNIVPEPCALFTFVGSLTLLKRSRRSPRRAGRES